MKNTIKISGMHCENCAKIVKNLLEENNVNASINIKNKTAEIEYKKEKIKIDKIIIILEERGFIVKILK